MKKTYLVLLFAFAGLGVGLSAQMAIAQTDAADRATVVVTKTSSNSFFAPADYERTFAVGAAYTYNAKQDGTNGSYGQSSGEIFGYYYYEMNDQFTLRPGLRFGYTPGQEPTTYVASAISIHENDFKGSGELTLIWRRFKIFPAFTLGAGAVYRSTSVTSQGPVLNTSQSAINGTSILGFYQGQFSIIVPIIKGKFEIAPFVRYTFIVDDPRVSWYFGGEVSIAFF